MRRCSFFWEYSELRLARQVRLGRINVKKLILLTAVLAGLVSCASFPGARIVTDADRIIVFKGASRDWVFDKTRQYLQDSIIRVPHHERGVRGIQMIPYRQTTKTEIISASEEDGLVVALWELKQESGAEFLVQRYTANFRKVEGGMEVILSIVSTTGAEAGLLYYTRFWDFMMGRYDEN
jgi:hypothetical protein